MKTFSGNKDVDSKILQDLPDRDLFNVCSIQNKYVQSICESPDFWMNRFIKIFGQEASLYKPQNRTWKTHYLQTVIDLESLTPIQFFENVVWDVENQKVYFAIRDQSFFTNIIELVPMEEAPEWFKTYFWLKKFDITITEEVYKPTKTYKNITPAELVKQFPNRKYVSQIQEDVFNRGNFYPVNETREINKLLN